jgi:hypothetical protein
MSVLGIRGSGFKVQGSELRPTRERLYASRIRAAILGFIEFLPV